jgi:hypothetical protein
MKFPDGMKAGAAGVSVAVALAGTAALLAAMPQDPPPASKDNGDAATPRPAARLGPWLKGIVVDERGKPVAGARVAPMWAVPPRSTTSHADGAFVLERNEPGMVDQSFLASADGGARQGIFRLDGPSGYRGPRTLVRIVLRPAREVTVTVVDGRGAPVPDAVVVALDRSFPVAEARTDARGIAVLRVPADANMQWIIGCKPGAGFDYFENERNIGVSPWVRPPRRARLVLDGVWTVRIRAVDSAGRPVPGVELATTWIRKKGKFGGVQFVGFPIKVRTDADGVATFDWLPAGLQNPASFHSASPSYVLPDWPVLDPDKLDADLTALVLRSTRVSGTVWFPDGSPAPGIVVEAHGWGGRRMPLSQSARARTAEDGSYAMDLPPEYSYMIGVTDDDWVARGLGGIVVREGVARPGLDLLLERGGVVRGRVTFESGAKPAPGRTVQLVEQGAPMAAGLLPAQFAGMRDSLARFAETDEDGRYTLRVGSGTHRLVGPIVQGRPTRQINLKIAAGKLIEWNFVVPHEEPPWKTVRGVVRTGDAGGAPIAGALLVVAPVDEPVPSVHGDADDQGRFELPCPAGKFIIYARNPENTLASYAVVDNPEGHEVAIVARPATTAHGRVVDQNGKPWASTNVVYYVEVDSARIRQEVLTDADGRFTAPGLPVGTKCDFYAYAPGASNCPSRSMEVKDAQPFEVPPLVVDRPRPLSTAPGPR